MEQFKIQDSDFASLKDKVVVVTGGSSGIGLATVQLLLSIGSRVVVGDQNELSISDSNLTFVKTDVTSWKDQLALFKTAHDKHKRIDHVFSNAGIGPRVDYFASNVDAAGQLQEPVSLTLDINLRGMINTSYLGLHYMKSVNSPSGGSIVCTASASSFQRFSAVDYTTAKHGVLGFMRGIVAGIKGTADLPIRINSIAPSWTITGLVQESVIGPTGAETQSAKVVARNVAVLMADESRQGQLIYSSGGRYYEVEDQVFMPAAAKIMGGNADTLQDAIQDEKIRELVEVKGENVALKTGFDEKA